MANLKQMSFQQIRTAFQKDEDLSIDTSYCPCNSNIDLNRFTFDTESEIESIFQQSPSP